MKKIILDTNFLMIPHKFNVDIFSELHRICNFNYELFIVDSSIEELKRIIGKKSAKDKKGAKLALLLINAKKIGVIKTKENSEQDFYVDLWILNNLVKDTNKNTFVATQDVGLKKELLKRGIPVITLRKKAHLIMVGYQ